MALGSVGSLARGWAGVGEKEGAIQGHIPGDPASREEEEGVRRDLGEAGWV